MTALIALPAHPLLHGLVHALGWTLLHLCWQAAIVAAMLWCVLRILSGQSSQLRYMAACSALTLMVVLPLLTFARLASTEYKLALASRTTTIVIDPGIYLRVGLDSSVAPWPIRIATALDHSVPWLLLLWCVGVIIFSARLNLGLIAARRMKSAETQTPPAELQQLFQSLRIRLGIARAVRLMHSALVQVPTVIGWLRPIVLIPASCLTGLSATQIEAILCHELAHVRRHDYLISVFQSVVEALLFYHPAVWWVSKQVRLERECCCDELAVSIGGDALAYAKALSYLEVRRSFYPEIAVAANGGVLTMRIKRLLGCKENSVGSQLAALLILSAVIAVAAFYVVATARAEARSAQPRSSSASAQAQSTVPTKPGAAPTTSTTVHVTSEQAKGSIDDLKPEYRNWLNVDVVWIITPEERSAFQQLTTDEDRDRFIQKFWEQRNPTPSSPENSFKEELYTRTAYANAHFASDMPGWRSDRGRAYIVNGKPYEIDSHPAGGQDGGTTSNLPYEVWHYIAAPAGGHDIYLKFVDQCQCGNYRLVSQTPGATSAQTNSPPSLVPAAAPTGPVRLSAGVLQGYLIPPDPMVYPAEAKEKHVEGVVILHALIAKDGTIKQLNIISGPPLLVKGAMDAVSRWKYRPYMLQGIPTEVETTINVNFTFDKKDVTAPDKELYDRGLQAIQDGRYEFARMALQTILNTFPDSPYAPRAQEAIADSWQKEGIGPPKDISDTASTDQSAAPGKTDGNASSPLAIYMVEPEYTPQASAAKFQGVVVVNLIVNEHGLPMNVHILRGVGMGLDEKAVEAVKQYRFRPAIVDGKPVSTVLNIEVKFKSDDSASRDVQNSRSDNSDDVPRKIGGSVSTPVLIYMVPPEYSKEAKKAKMRGTVLVNLIVDANGLPQNVHVLRGLGNGLDEKAVEAVKQYKFKPAMEAGKPVAVELNVEVNFQIF